MILDLVLLLLSILIFVSILVGKIGNRLGIPALVLFLGVGMVFGKAGVGIAFNDLNLAESIGTVALCIILFSGGLHTKFKDIKPVIGRGIVLSTVGVFITAFSTGLFTWWLCGELLPALGIGFLVSFLLASVISSTDSAAVFAILSSKNVQLKNNLRPTLEFESGSNDPMAYMLTITLISLIQKGGEPDYLAIVVSILKELIVGAAVGYFIGKLAVKTLNNVKIDNDVYYPVVVFTFCIFIFSFANFIDGNGYLAVYLGGLVIGNSRFITKRTTFNFFDAVSWLSQIVMFLTLGLLVNPKELVVHAFPAMLICVFMMLIARPLSVFICLFAFRKVSVPDKIFISWVGLRGAVPIIFALFPLTAGIAHAHFIFNVVFFITIFSVVLQGTFLTQVANWLGLLLPSHRRKKAHNFDVDLPEDIGSMSVELSITPKAIENGKKLMNLPLPDEVLVVMIKRDHKYFIPKGKTEVQVGDKLLVMMNSEETYNQTLENMGLSVGDQ